MQSLQSEIIKVLTFPGHFILDAVKIAKIKTVSVFIWDMCMQLFPLGRICLSDFFWGCTHQLIVGD